MNPDVWVSREKQKNMTTFTIPADTWVDEQTGNLLTMSSLWSLTLFSSDLTPFWNGSETFWKSAGAVKDWTRFNSDYPEFADLKDKSPAERRKAILNIIKQMYGPQTPLSMMAAGAEAVPEEPKVAECAPAEQVSLKAAPAAEGKPDILDWFVRVRSGRFALSMTYTILLFLGEPPESESEYRTSPNLVGYHTIFVSSRADLCANCQTQANNIDEGFVNLNGRLKSLDYISKSEEEAEAYLKENLKWRVQKVRLCASLVTSTAEQMNADRCDRCAGRRGGWSRDRSYDGSTRMV